MACTHTGRQNHHDASLGGPEGDMMSGKGPKEASNLIQGCPSPQPSSTQGPPLLLSSCGGCAPCRHSWTQGSLGGSCPWRMLPGLGG